ncbi:glycosyl transferase family, helical bundle domain protein [Mycobacterium kansasii]|uniref:Glycosyl transferase family, helical bundle domain protein n=1 Tax=Mycobacterium kansasii TaxID=1768 RepID=A0A1V3XXP6_MYCKA|nr:glycosyl transferase family, helical bundle domain protein [Mycobacterium kansasii]
MIQAFTDGRVAPEQMSALLMAIFWRGMDSGETARWTSAMLASGTRMDFADLRLPTVDKHSTGGVGDKITLPLVPVVVACGAAVPQAAAGGSAIPAARWTSWNPSPGSPRRFPINGCANNFATSVRPSSRPASWPPPMPSSMRCATSPAPSNPCR